MVYLGVPKAIQLRFSPNVSESTMDFVVHALDSPTYRVGRNSNRVHIGEPLHRTAKLRRVPWINLRPTSFSA